MKTPITHVACVSLLIALYPNNGGAQLATPTPSGFNRSLFRLDNDEFDNSLEKQTIALGYDKLFGETKPTKCVELKSGKPQLGEPQNTPTTALKISNIENNNSYASFTQLSVAGAFDFGAQKGDASANYLFSTRMSSYRAVAIQRLSVDYPNQSYATNDFQPTKEGRKYAGLGPSVFRFYCGDSFVLGFTRGGDLYTSISIDASSREEQNEISGAINSSGMNGSISVSLQNTIEQKQSQGQSSIEVIRNGTEDVLPPLDFASMGRYALDFPKKIADLKQKPIKNLSLGDYSAVFVAGPLPGSPNPEPWEDQVGAEFAYLLQLARYNSDLGYVRDHESQFIGFDHNLLARRLIEASTAIQTVKSWAGECVRTKGGNCPDITKSRLAIPAYSPSRADSWKTDFKPKDPREQIIGSTTARSTLETKGHWVFGSYALNPVTTSTTIIIKDHANPAAIDARRTALSQTIPANSDVYFRFDDIAYSDNDQYPPDPVATRLGGDISGFILGQD